jgi:hypothetical protein
MESPGASHIPASALRGRFFQRMPCAPTNEEYPSGHPGDVFDSAFSIWVSPTGCIVTSGRPDNRTSDAGTDSIENRTRDENFELSSQLF